MQPPGDDGHQRPDNKLNHGIPRKIREAFAGRKRLEIVANQLCEHGPQLPNDDRAALSTDDGVIDVAVRVDVLKKRETESETLLSKAPFSSKRRALMYKQILAEVLQTAQQEILFADVMSVKRRPSDIRAIDNVLNRDDLVAFLDHQRYQSLVQHLPGPLYAAIHADPPRFSEQIGVNLALLGISQRGNYSSILTTLLITNVVVLVTLEFLFPIRREWKIGNIDGAMNWTAVLGAFCGGATPRIIFPEQVY